MGAGLALAGGALSGIGSIFGGGKQAAAAGQAAQAQIQAAQIAQQTELQMFGEAKNLLQPYIDYGTSAIPTLASEIGVAPGTSPATAPLTAPLDTTYTPFDPTPKMLETTPGYQFQIATGTDAIKNQFAGRGGVVPGGALSPGSTSTGGMGGGFGTSLINFLTGTAQGTWQQQLQAYMQQYQQKLAGVQTELGQRGQIFNMLTSPVQVGGSAATSLANSATNVGGQIAQLQTSAGAAAASGIVGAANAQAAGITGAGNALGGSALAYLINQGGGNPFSSGYASPGSAYPNLPQYSSTNEAGFPTEFGYG